MAIPAWVSGGVWLAALAAGGVAFGLGFLTQSVTIPLWGVLVLTFVPTSNLVSLANSAIDRADRRLKSDQ